MNTALPSEPSPPRGPPRSVRAGLIIAFVASFIALNGYSFGGITDRLPGTSPSSDHANVLPWIDWYRDHSLYPRDFQIQMGVSYPTVIWPAVAMLPRVIPLEWDFFALHVLTLAAVCALLVALARELGCDGWQAWLAPIFFAAARVSPGGEPTFDAAFYLRSVGLPISLAAIWLALRGRHFAALLCICGCMTIHGATAFHAAVVVATFVLLDTGRSIARRLAVIGMFVVLAIPISRVIGSASFGAWEPASPAFLELQQMTNGAQLFLPEWNSSAWRPLIAFIPLIIATAADVSATAATRRLARVMLLAMAGMITLDWLAMHGLPLKIFLQVMPLRITKVILVLCMVLAPGWLFRQLRRAMDRRGSRKFAALAACFIVVAGWAGRWDETALVGLVMLALLDRSAKYLNLPASILCLSWIACVGWTVPGLVAICVCGAGVLVALVLTISRATVASTSWIGVVVAIGALAATPLQRDNVWVYAAWDFPWRPRHSPWIDVQRWCAANLPASSLVMAPPWLEGFRTYGKRSLLVDWKTGGMALLNESFGNEWKRRIERLAPRDLSPRLYDNLDLNYDGLSAQEVAAVVREYGVTHLVTKCGGATQYRELYSNGALRVLSTER